MANKKILVSDGNGKYKEVAASIDDGVLSASVSALTASFINTAISGPLQVITGTFAPFWTTSSIPGYLQDNDNNPTTPPNLAGCLFQVRTDIGQYAGIGPHRIESASFSGDIIGTLSSSLPIRVISVGNVNSGTLDSRYGGTSTSSFAVDSLVTLSGSGLKPSDGSSGQTVAVNSSGQWSNQNISVSNFTALTESLVYLFTGSVGGSGLTSSVNWIKPGTIGSLYPNSGRPRFIRVICQGGGGGGGRPNNGGSTNVLAGGGGGGGYSDIIFNADNILDTVSCTIGNGGAGASSAGATGGNGGVSAFGNYITGSGGTGGFASNTIGGGSAGAAYNIYGGAGGNGGANSGTNVKLGGAGGGGGGNSTSASGIGGSITLINITGSAAVVQNTGGSAASPQTGNCFKFSSVTLNNTASQPMPNLLSAGGTGGGGIGGVATGGAGSSATFGSGGGGGGRGNPSGNGGNGGKGYVLIICT